MTVKYRLQRSRVIFSDCSSMFHWHNVLWVDESKLMKDKTDETQSLILSGESSNLVGAS